MKDKCKTKCSPRKKEKEEKKLVPSLANLSSKEKRELEEYVDLYAEFLDKARTPRQVVDYVERLAYTFGFDRDENNKIFINEDRNNIALVNYGQFPVSEGIRILGAHVDSPCLHLKDSPLIEDPHLRVVRLDTQYYGGIVKYQWFDQDVDVVGYVVKNGKEIPVSIEGTIHDVAPHINRKTYEKTINEAFEAENLDVVTKYANKEELLKDLGIEERDFYRADICVVPAMKTRVLGDLVSGYGHDDRVCVFTQLMALLKSKPEYTSIVFGVDMEEKGSTGGGGAQATFFDRVLDQIISEKDCRDLNFITQPYIRDILSKSMMISADVDIATSYRNVNLVDKDKNTKAGWGLAINTYCGSGGKYMGNQASAVFMDKLMTILDKKSVVYQVGGLPSKVDSGGGGTIAKYFAERGVPTVDGGVPVVGMHGKREIIHRGDLYQAVKCFKAFLEG